MNFLNSQHFLPVTSAGNIDTHFCSCCCRNGKPQGQWLDVFALGVWAGWGIPIPYAYLYVSGDNRVPGAWGRTECDLMGCMLGWALPEVKVNGATLRRVLEEAPSSSGCFWTWDLSQPQLLCCLQKYGGESGLSTLLPTHFLEAISDLH